MGSDLEVILTGMNLDVEALNQIRDTLSRGDLSEEQKILALKNLSELTPETLNAFAARISRDPKPLSEILKSAREDINQSRAMNSRIIFDMGHKSVAEHAFFNISVTGLSRRAIEEVEKKRLQSYLEKSQRYVTFNGDFVIPSEIRGTPLERDYVEQAEKENKFYQDNLPKAIQWHKEQHPEMASDPKKKNVLEGYGKEDVRYALPLSTQTQLVISASARNLERAITESLSSESSEVREFGEKLLKVVKGIAPSVIKYTNKTDYFAETRKRLREYIRNILPEENIVEYPTPDLHSENVNLFTELKRDDSIFAGLIFSSTRLPYNACLDVVKRLDLKQKIKILQISDMYQEKHDPKLREYELGDRVFEVELAASTFADFKRQRMDTIISQPYNINLPSRAPKSIIKIGAEKELLELVKESSSLYNKFISEGLPECVAEYVLMNAHRRRTLLDANNRQIYAICSERESNAAQWDMRDIFNKVHYLVQQDSPLTTAYLCGKDRFDEMKEERYS